MNVIATIGLSLALASNHFSETKLIGGKRLSPFELTAVQELDLGSHQCTGVLVGPRVVATAAHCVLGNQTGQFTGIPVRFKIHPDYYKNEIALPDAYLKKYDIALGILEKTPPSIFPLSLTKQVPQQGDTVIEAGRGAPSHQRKFHEAKVIQVGRFGINTSGYDTQSSPHFGDSGGATLIKKSDGTVELVGTISNGSGEKYDSYHATTGKPCRMGSKNCITVRPFTTGSTYNTGPEVRPFFQEFEKTYSVKICGISQKCAPVFFPRPSLPGTRE